MQTSAARVLEIEGDLRQDIGTVTEASAGGFTVENAGGSFRATRAVSCLVEPELDDAVLFAGRRKGPQFILAVLERSGERPTTLSVEGDLRLQARDGRLTVMASRGMDLVSTEDIALTSRGLQLRAVEGHVFIESLSYLGSRVLAEVEKVKNRFGTLDAVLDRITQRVKRSYRFVDVIDQVRAGQVDVVAENTMRLKGKNALVNAELLVKVDGDQIHLG